MCVDEDDIEYGRVDQTRERRHGDVGYGASLARETNLVLDSPLRNLQHGSSYEEELDTRKSQPGMNDDS